jgi:hypothetical protein
MTYDQWKTTDPRDYEPEEEREPSELEVVYEQLRDVLETAVYDANVSANRIKKLESALEEALEYFKERYDIKDIKDIKDGKGGQQLPNEEMRIGQMIDETLYGIRF